MFKGTKKPQALTMGNLFHYLGRACWYHESTMLNQRNSYAKQNLKTTGLFVNLTSDLSLVILLVQYEIHLIGRLIEDLFNV